MVLGWRLAEVNSQMGYAGPARCQASDVGL